MKLLVIVDMQNDFLTGALRNEEAIKIIPNVLKEIKNADKDTVIIATEDTHDENYMNTIEGKKLPVPHCIKHTSGIKIEDSIYKVLKEKNAVIIQKETFGYKDWERILSPVNITEIELVGVCTDICVISNAMLLKAIYPNVPISVKESCCAGVTPETHKNALEAMKMCHIDII